MKWVFCALVLILAVGAGVVFVVDGTPGPSPIPEPEPARSDAPRAAAEMALEPVLPERAPATARPSPAPVSPRSVSRPVATEDHVDAQIEEELRWTEQAIEASQRFSEPAGVGAAPSPEEHAAANSGAAARVLCKGAGFACGSSAECCAGLACVGGLAGYGTPGRCQGAR